MQNKEGVKMYSQQLTGDLHKWRRLLEDINLISEKRVVQRSKRARFSETNVWRNRGKALVTPKYVQVN